MNFTFLTVTTDAPVLGEKENKVMRAHVTRTNFARRRQRAAARASTLQLLEDAGPSSQSSRRAEQKGLQSTRFRNAPLPLRILPTDPDLALRRLLHDFRPILFAAGASSAVVLTAIDWIHLIRSERALLEATLLFATGHYRDVKFASPDYHRARAISLINMRIDQGPVALTDGVIGAVFTLAHCERLAGNMAASNIHMNGLTQMLSLRRLSEQSAIPTWFSDLILFDAVGESVSIRPKIHNKAVRVLPETDIETLSNLDCISRSINALRQVLELFHNQKLPADLLCCEIDKQVALIGAQVSALFGINAYVNALSTSLLIFLHISWPRVPLFNASPEKMAEEMAEMLKQPDIRLCTSLDLTAWQLMVGGISASDSTVRQWFGSVLKRMNIAMRVTKWDDILFVLNKTFMPDSRLLYRFKLFWEELDSP